MTYSLDCIKAYDIRGRVPDVLNADFAYDLARAYSTVFQPKTLVVGHDIRQEGPELNEALCRGFAESGVQVLHLGLCGTEEVYFATSHYQADGGIMITASHNPKGYNGMKLVKNGSQPIGQDSGLKDIKTTMASQSFCETVPTPTPLVEIHDKSAYIQHLLGLIDLDELKPLKILVNAGNGAAGPTFDQLAKHLPFEFIRMQHEPDGNFPNGIPNPMLFENREVTANALKENQADFAVAWDGDFDRCFLFDETGYFIEGYYLVGLLAKTLLERNPGEKIIYDPRMTWNTIEQVTESGGIPLQCRTGHSFIKDMMRRENAIYGGEMSAHHYFRDFFYCDSGMIPWLLIAELMSKTGKTLSDLIGDRAKRFPCSGELNYKVTNAKAIMQAVEAAYLPLNPVIDPTDGIGYEFKEWRMNMRTSNTEPLLRLNVESRGNPELVAAKVKEIEAIIERIG